MSNKQLAKQLVRLAELVLTASRVDITPEQAKQIDRLMDQEESTTSFLTGPKHDPYSGSKTTFTADSLLGKYLSEQGLLKNGELGVDMGRYFAWYDIGSRTLGRRTTWTIRALGV